jgi:hypothetical protein
MATKEKQNKLSKEDRKERFELFVQVFQNEIKGNGSWIQRKEIAIWAAVSFYLTGLFLIAKYCFESVGEKIPLTILLFPGSVLAIMFVFIYFIFIQFGFIASAVERQRAIFHWLMISFENVQIPGNFRFEKIENDNSPYPKSILDIIIDKNNRYKVRKTGFYCRLFLPYKHFILKQTKNFKFDHIELEEAVIYNLIIIPTGLVLLYYYFSIIIIEISFYWRNIIEIRICS